MDERPDARIEGDFVRPLKPMKSASRRHLPAALPIAIAGLLVVTSVAFGATVMTAIGGASQPNATPVVLDDEPEPTEAADPTAEPTDEPTPAELTLTAALSGGKVVLTWNGYAGDDFAYYKVVRSTDATVEWPLGEGDKLIAAISERTKLTVTDAAPASSTLSYRVFAVKCSEEGYAILAASNVVTIETPAPTPKPTPKPTANCRMSLSASIISGAAQPNVVAPSVAVKLTWTKYRCSHFQYYVVGRSTDSDVNFPLPHGNTQPLHEEPDISTVTFIDHDVESGGTYWYRVMAWNSEVFCNGGTVLAKTNSVKVVIP